MPCDSRTVIQTAYKPEGLRFLLRAASRLGWKVTHASADGECVALESLTGQTVEVSGSGALSVARAAEREAGALMRAYAQGVFEDWAASSPDLYEEVDREIEFDGNASVSTVTYNIKK